MSFEQFEMEARIDEFSREFSDSNLTEKDLVAISEIQSEDAGWLRRRIATALVELGMKVDANAVVGRAASHEAA